MNLKAKKQKTDKLVLKLKRIAKVSVEKGDQEKALQALEAVSLLLYKYNQKYIDDEIEDMLQQLSLSIKADFPIDEIETAKNTIIFYDGFALDNRGVAEIYLNGLVKGGFKVVYAYSSKMTDNIPNLTSFCLKNSIEMVPIAFEKSYLKYALEIVKVFIEKKPEKAIFYTTPHDVSGTIAFGVFKGKVERFLIDLTDHAFWIGKLSNDYFFGSRNMSSYIEHYEKGIEKERLIKLGANLIVKEYNDHSGLPFDVEKERYVFSGGALYKTLGDPENTYYRIVDHILDNHSEVKFLYAGEGDNSQLLLLEKKYPGRVFQVKERKDFYYLIQKCVFYLNTYPVFGGMMMTYSAQALKIPLTLKHGFDSDGFLLNQGELQIEYSDYNELVDDIDELLDDADYLKEREMKLVDSVITEERFVKNIKSALTIHKTDYPHHFQTYDTAPFRNEYLARFNYIKAKLAFCDNQHKKLFAHFPIHFILAGMAFFLRHRH